MKPAKKRLTPELKRMVDRYKLISQEEERYLGSVFANPNSSRAKNYEKELIDLATRFKKMSGISIDAYTWKSWQGGQF
jgi:hypothetical protein